MKISFVVCFAICLLMTAACVQKTSDTNQLETTGLAITWTLLTNKIEAGLYRASITIQNNNTSPLQDSWTIFFNQMTGSVLESSIDPGIRIEHITGDYWKILPTPEFKSLETGQERTFEYEVSGAISSISKTPRAVYYILGDSQPQPAEYQLAPWGFRSFLKRHNIIFVTF